MVTVLRLGRKAADGTFTLSEISQVCHSDETPAVSLSKSAHKEA
jgi:hypothetical protein